MAIFGIGAFYEGEGGDMTDSFWSRNVACIGWSENDVPSLHSLMRHIKVGDIIYIKAHPPNQGLIVKAVGLVLTDQIQRVEEVEETCLAVRWIWRGHEVIGRTGDRYNVRNNTLYEEMNPDIQRRVLDLLLSMMERRPFRRGD